MTACPSSFGGEAYASWLDSDNQDANRLPALLRPANPEGWTMHAVSRQVNSRRNDGSELLEAFTVAQ